MKHFNILILCLLFVVFARPCFSNDMIASFYDPAHEATPEQLELVEASTRGQADVVKQLLDKGVVFDWKLQAFKKSWIEIILNKRLAVIELLLNTGMDINAIDLEDINGRSALMEAMGTDEATVDLLLSRGPKIDLKDKNGETALFHALWFKEHVSFAAKLIKAGADVNHVSHIKETPLLRAINRGNKEAVILLLDAKADIEFKERPRTTPLIAASEGGFEDIVNLLLDRGAQINAREQLGITALMAASMRGQANIVKLLLDRGADEGIALPNGQDAMKLAASSGYGDVVKVFLDRQGKKGLSKETLEQMTNAVSQGHKDVLGAFLDQGFDVNVADDYGDTLLMKACRDGQLEIVKMFLERGANIETANKKGEKAVDGALWRNDPQILKVLIDHGATKPMKDINGTPPFIHAVYSGNVDLVHLMFSLGYDMNQQDAQGLSPLHIASAISYNDDSRMTVFLLEHGADIESLEGGAACKNPAPPVPVAVPVAQLAGDSANSVRVPFVYVPLCETPLMKTVSVGHFNITKVLLEHGAKINFQSPANGNSPLIEAANLGDPQIVELLLARGADMNLRNKENLTALEVAEQKGNTKAAVILRNKK